MALAFSPHATCKPIAPLMAIIWLGLALIHFMLVSLRVIYSATPFLPAPITATDFLAALNIWHNDCQMSGTVLQH